MSPLQSFRTNPAPMVVFGEDWGRHPSSTQHLIRRLMQDRPIVWINSIGMRRPRLADLGRVKAKLAAMMSGTRAIDVDKETKDVAQPLEIIAPHAVSWPGSRLAALLNRWSLGRQIRHSLSDHGLEKPVFWTSLPTAVDVIGAFADSICVYYAGDDFTALAGVDHAPIARMEAKLAQKADIIIAASDVIASRFPPHKTFIIPHGADIELFSTPQPQPADLAFASQEHPVAGFYGAIDAWVDTELLAETARRMPNWRFVMIGPVRTDISALAKQSNVTFLGPKAHRDLPAYSQNWTVSMLPFRDNDQIRACNPLKLREYLAAGTPVVSTPFPAARPYRAHIAFAETPETFTEQLTAAMQETPSQRAERQTSVRNQTWEARAAEVGILLQALQNGTTASA